MESINIGLPWHIHMLIQFGLICFCFIFVDCTCNICVRFLCDIRSKRLTTIAENGFESTSSTLVLDSSDVQGLLNSFRLLSLVQPQLYHRRRSIWKISIYKSIRFDGGGGKHCRKPSSHLSICRYVFISFPCNLIRTFYLSRQRRVPCSTAWQRHKNSSQKETENSHADRQTNSVNKNEE